MLGLGLSIGAGAGGAGILPTLDLDFLTGALDPRITFTRASTGTYIGSDGLLKTAAVGEPRFDYDPVTLQPRGLLIQGLRTNLLLQSNNFANAVWVKSASIALAGYVVTASSAVHAIYQTFIVTPGTIYTFSFYAQRGTMTDAKYSVFDVTNALNIIAPTSYYSSISDARMTRVTVTFTAPAGCTTVRVFPLRDSGVTGTITIGSDLLGSQGEAGAFATSYIPTTTAAVTRAADSVVMTGAQFSSWFNPVEGTLVFESEIDGYAPTANDGIVSFTGVNEVTDKIQVFLASAGPNYRADITAGGVNSFLQNAVSAPDIFKTIRCGMAWSANNAYSCSNFFTGNPTDTSVVVPNVNKLRLITANNAMHMRRLRYWPTRLSNARVQELVA